MKKKVLLLFDIVCHSCTGTIKSLCIFKRLLNVTAQRQDNLKGKKLRYKYQSYRVLPELEPVSSDVKKGILGQGQTPPLVLRGRLLKAMHIIYFVSHDTQVVCW